jgi:hypothetical protein
MDNAIDKTNTIKAGIASLNKRIRFFIKVSFINAIRNLLQNIPIKPS